MNFQPSQFLVYKVEANYRDFLDSYTDENSLTSVLPGLKTRADLTEYPIPQMMTQMGDIVDMPRSPFLKLMEEEGETIYIDEEYFSHKLMDNGINYIIAVQDMNEDDECPGIDGKPFPVKLNDGTLKYGDFIAPASFKMYPVRIVSHRAEKVGMSYIYNVEYITANDNEYYPKSALRANIKWEKMWHAVGEATSLRGSFKSSMTKGWVEYAGNMTTISKSVKVTDKAHHQFLRFEFEKNSLGNPNVIPKALPDQIINYIEAEFIMQLPKEEENFYLWGKANAKPLKQSRATDDSSTYHVNVGNGWFQYATYGPIRTYSPKRFDMEELKTEIVTQVNQRISYDKYNWVAVAGGRAIQLMIDDMNKKYKQGGYVTHHDNVTGSAEAIDKVNRRGVELFTEQFTKINFDPYGSIRLSHWRELDSPQFLGGDLTYDGSPLSSWWIFFLNLGLRGGKAKNIQKIIKRNSEMFAYVCGVLTPRGFVNSLNYEERIKYQPGATHKGAFYELEWQKTIGFNMRDTSNMLWFIPNIGM